MKPTEFSEQTKVLSKPVGWSDDECSPLGVWTDGRECISRWEPTLRERIALLFGAPVWLRVVSGKTQPPVALQAKRTLFMRLV